VTSRGSHWDKNAPQLQCPRPRNTWVSKAISHHRETSKSRLKTPTLGKTPYLEPLLLFLGKHKKLVGSGRNRDRKIGRISIRRSNHQRSKFMRTYPTIS
ncbi:unnamed protein product, partial [Prunus brigantina]